MREKKTVFKLFFVWDFEKGWCVYDKNSGTCVRKDNINDFVELGIHVVWLK